MTIQRNISLKPYNTFGVDAIAAEFVVINSIEELKELIPYLHSKKYMFLGGGSNVLFTEDYSGLIILNNIKGIEHISSESNNHTISAYSGENWHSFVLWTLDNGYFGLENLSLIPGTVGAAPMQNIGAYGVETKDTCVLVKALELNTGKLIDFSAEDCKFGYRESIFKRDLKNQYFIYQVHFELKTDSPLHLNYGTIKEELTKNNIKTPTHRDVSDAVIRIRRSKLPDPKIIGNAGSFFKNPIISQAQVDSLRQKYPNMPSYPDTNGVKIPAGWLIEEAGFKGKITGNTGSHKSQALVIVNYGNASGIEIYNYSTEVIKTIQTKFEIILEREVNLVE